MVTYTVWVIRHCQIASQPSPSTITVALDLNKLSSEQLTNEQLFSDVILPIVMVAGLANGTVSGELTCTISSPALGVTLAVPPWTLRSTVQNIPLISKLLLQVNVMFPPSGTTYPPGAGTASADRVTVEGKTALQNFYCTKLYIGYAMSKDIHSMLAIKFYS